MQELKQLHELSKLLAKSVGVETGENSTSKPNADEEKKLANNIRLIYAASKNQIYKIADRLVSYREPTFTKLCEQEKYPTIPQKDDWGFKVGDAVRIKCSLRDFRYIQKETVGWGKRLAMISDRISIVTRVRCPSDCCIRVYTPEAFSYSDVHAAVLEKAPEGYKCTVPTQWNIGDSVRTKTDKNVVELLQRGMRKIPDKFIGKRGRVVAVSSTAVIVTFDEVECYEIKPYLLIRSDSKAPLTRSDIELTRDLKVGEKVQMISNLKKLISNQVGKGGWNSDMTNLRGEQVTIVEIADDETVAVQLKTGKTWSVNPASIMKMTEVGMETKVEDVPFPRGQRVKFKLPPNVRATLAAAGVPSIFLEYLKMTAVICSVDDDYDYYFKYNCQQRVSVRAPFVKKVSRSEADEYDTILDHAKNLGVGDTVFLDVGPPNYVKAVLKEVETSDEIIEVMTNPQTLVGFADDNRAVIETKNGKRFRIKKKFLTIPEKFDARERNESFDFESVAELQRDIQRCVKEVHDGEGIQADYKVGVHSMAQGVPPTVNLRVRSLLASGDEVTKKLAAIPRWKIQILCEGLFHVKGFSNYPYWVKVSLSFNNDEFPDQADGAEPKEEHGRIEEGAQLGAAAVPFVDGGQQPCQQVQPERPIVENLGDFRFVRLYDPALAQNVYFPYIVQGPTRAPAQDRAGENRDDAQRQVNNTYYIDKVDSIHHF